MFALKKMDRIVQKATGADAPLSLRDCLSAAYGDPKKVKAAATKFQNGKSLVAGKASGKKDVWDF